MCSQSVFQVSTPCRTGVSQTPGVMLCGERWLTESRNICASAKATGISRHILQGDLLKLSRMSTHRRVLFETVRVMHLVHTNARVCFRNVLVRRFGSSIATSTKSKVFYITYRYVRVAFFKVLLCVISSQFNITSHSKTRHGPLLSGSTPQHVHPR